MKRGFFTILFGLAVLLAGLVMAVPPVAAQTGANSSTRELAAQRARPRITIRPRRTKLGPNAKRHCRAKLVQEYRVSGTVIVPRMHCWWE